jgi:hypothetical protein
MIELSLSGPDLEGLAARIAGRREFKDTSPDSIEVDYREQPVTPGWAGRIAGTGTLFEAVWEDERRLAVYKNQTIELTVPLPAEAEPVIDWLIDLDFELASFQTLHPEWARIDPDYIPPGFTNRHRNHGPFAAIKGAGHRRLVSNRWLDYCPVKLVRRGDLSFVQFHALDADAALSLAQAKSGHLALSSAAEGGFVKDGYLLRHEFNGVLEQARHVLKVAVIGRPVTPREMLDACAARGEIKGEEVRNIGFVFLEEQAASDHLHALWLRGLECWTIRDGREVRLDDTYAPPPAIAPPWAR